MKKLFLVGLCLLFLVFNSFSQTVAHKEEYAVYAAVLNDIYKNEDQQSSRKSRRKFVILDQTKIYKDESEQAKSGSAEVFKPDAEMQKHLNDFVAVLRKAKTGENFDLRNQQSSKLEKLIPINLKYNIVSKNEIDELRKLGNEEYANSQKDRKHKTAIYGDEGWKYFYKKHPNAKGYYQFSRVGFNYNKTYAQVLIENEGGYWNSNTTYILKKIRGRWKIPTQFGFGNVS